MCPVLWSNSRRTIRRHLGRPQFIGRLGGEGLPEVVGQGHGYKWVHKNEFVSVREVLTLIIQLLFQFFKHNINSIFKVFT